VKRILTTCLLVLLAACSDDDGTFRHARQLDGGGGTTKREPGVCTLADCPVPDMGIACCTPLAQCGFDPNGLGLNCVPNPGEPVADRVCKLADCPTPTLGTACCTPLALCGFDPFASGLICLGYPPPTPPVGDAGVSVCEVSSCPQPDTGFACCLANGECGVDPFGINLCFVPPPPPVDAGTPPPISTSPPDDPSVTGECPSYLGAFGPVWGCCSDYGVCGTFASGTCLLPIGAPLPIDPDGDAGLPAPFLRCSPP